MSASVKVAVRVRPFNDREKKRSAKLIIDMPEETPGQVSIEHPKTGKKKIFNFDYAYWSNDHSKPFADQVRVYQDLGSDILDNSFKGFNFTLFAYGQTGSGKSYSMMGADDGPNAGIIPRACDGLFKRINTMAESDDHITFTVEVSYLEIYNEKLRDLLSPGRKKGDTTSLKIRQDPHNGVFVPGLTKHLVRAFPDITHLIEMGDKMRTVAATQMNATSSRSHSVFTVLLTQTKVHPELGTKSHMTSKINLVDLAGSERAESTGATGQRLKEGCFSPETLVLLANGSEARVDSLVVGQKLMGPDGLPRTVIAIPRGTAQMYNLTLTGQAGVASTTHVVSDHHVLSLEFSHVDGDKTMRPVFEGNALREEVTEESGPFYFSMPVAAWLALKGPAKEYCLIREFAHQHPGDGHPDVIHVPAIESASAAAFEVSVTTDIAYYCGLWLGDGDASTAAIHQSDAHKGEALLVFLNRLHPQIQPGLDARKAGISYVIEDTEAGGYSKVHRMLRAAGFAANGSTSGKRIPECVHSWAPDARVAFLAGLMEGAGGEIRDPGQFAVTQSGGGDAWHPQLAKLGRLLGYRTTYETRDTGRVWCFSAPHNEAVSLLNRFTLFNSLAPRSQPRCGLGFTLSPFDGEALHPFVGVTLPADTDRLHVLPDGSVHHNCAINKSLSSLGQVIETLAHNCKPGAKKKMVPYRNSSLTYLLKESLGGNSITCMVAALSPADINYDETLSTLRYADRAKKIKNVAKINETPQEKYIRTLLAQIEDLKKRGGSGAPGATGTKADAAAESDSLEQIAEYQRMLEENTKSWEQRMAEALEKERAMAKNLAEMGIGSNDGPHLINLHEDPMMSETLLYQIKPGDTLIGSARGDQTPAAPAAGEEDGGDDAPVEAAAAPKADIVIGGLGVSPLHARFINADGPGDPSAVPDDSPNWKRNGTAVSVISLSDKFWVNGRLISPDQGPVRIFHGDRMLMGTQTWFRFVDPASAKIAKEDAEAEGLVFKPPLLDFDFAQREYSVEQAKASGLAVSDGSDFDDIRAEYKKAQERLLAEKEAAQIALEEERSRMQELIDRQASEAEQRAAAEKEAELARQAEEAERKRRVLEKKQKAAEEKQILDETISKVLPMTNEANLICAELGLPLAFSVELRTGLELEHGETHKRTDVMVAVADGDNGRIVLWGSDKFTGRVYAMREVYGNAMDVGPEAALDELDIMDNPFVDAEEQSQLIGSAQMFLSPLWYAMESALRTPIVTPTGDQAGELDMEVQPVFNDGIDPLLLDDGEMWKLGATVHLKLMLKRLLGLPPTLSKGAHCRYQWFLDDPVETPPAAGDSINPRVDYDADITVRGVTSEMQAYIESGVLIVEVFGFPTQQSAVLARLEDSDSSEEIDSPLVTPMASAAVRSAPAPSAASTAAHMAAVSAAVDDMSDSEDLDTLVSQIQQKHGSPEKKVVEEEAKPTPALSKHTTRPATPDAPLHDAPGGFFPSESEEAPEAPMPATPALPHRPEVQGPGTPSRCTTPARSDSGSKVPASGSPTPPVQEVHAQNVSEVPTEQTSCSCALF